MGGLSLAVLAAVTGLVAAGPGLPASPADSDTDSFPSVSEVLQGQVFSNKFDREVFFLRAIHDRYPAHWPSLLAANLTVVDYVVAPDKLREFIEELGTAMAGGNDLTTATNLVAILSDPAYHAHAGAYRPDVVAGTARALIGLGPKGKEALAAVFNETQYRSAPAILADLAGSIGSTGASDVKLTQALAATAFTFATTNGATYPHCTGAAITNLLRLPAGAGVVAAHLNVKEVFDNPGRFQAIVESITSAYDAASAAQLTASLRALQPAMIAKLGVLTNSPGAYRDDLAELDAGIRRALERLRTAPGTNGPAPISPRAPGPAADVLHDADDCQRVPHSSPQRRP
jgi:hypothetical protein